MPPSSTPSFPSAPPDDHQESLSTDTAPPPGAPTTPAQRHYIETLFRTHYADFSAYATCMGAPSKEDVEDAIQTAVERLLAGHRCLTSEDPNAVLKYIYTTVGGLIRNQRRDAAVDRRHRLHNARAVQDAIGPSPLPAPDVAFENTTVEETERQKRFRQALEACTPGQREIRLQGYTYIQIAGLLGIGVSTVNTQMVRALSRFRRPLQDAPPDEETNEQYQPNIKLAEAAIDDEVRQQ
jgi:RNA polymerase sigma-70 factor, ECF subfamily